MRRAEPGLAHAEIRIGVLLCTLLLGACAAPGSKSGPGSDDADSVGSETSEDTVGVGGLTGDGGALSDASPSSDADADGPVDAATDSFGDSAVALDVVDGGGPHADGVGDGGLGDTWEVGSKDSAAASGDTGPEIVAKPGSGEPPKVKFGGWPPPCANPRKAGDSKQFTPLQEYFCLPEAWCGNWSNSPDLWPACAADGSVCCVFNTGCLPCGWVSCFGCPSAKCPPGCTAQKGWFWQTPEVWFNKACIPLHAAMTKCVHCGDTAHCPPGVLPP